jgi:hypothetical protein
MWQFFSWINTLTSPLQCGDFDSKLEILYVHMVAKVVSVLKPFMYFVSKFFIAMVHNMFAFMLNLQYKSLQCIMEFLVRGATEIPIAN